MSWDAAMHEVSLAMRVAHEAIRLIEIAEVHLPPESRTYRSVLFGHSCMANALDALREAQERAPRECKELASEYAP